MAMTASAPGGGQNPTMTTSDEISGGEWRWPVGALPNLDALEEAATRSVTWTRHRCDPGRRASDSPRTMHHLDAESVETRPSPLPSPSEYRRKPPSLIKEESGSFVFVTWRCISAKIMG